MTNEEIVYIITLTINDKVTFNDLENVTDKLIRYIDDNLLSEIDVPSIEYSINNNIIYILITTRQEFKIKNSLIKNYLYDKIDNIEEMDTRKTEIKNLIKCKTNKLQNIRTLEEYFKDRSKFSKEAIKPTPQDIRDLITYILIGK